MTIDVRAIVICSLGPLISASISSDYLQGETGLITTKGNCEIADVINPQIGEIVEFSYIKNGVTRKVPHILRVISSFADPFRRTTSVEFGCTLTYFKDLKPAPTINGDSSYETGERQQCLNGYIEYPADSEFGIPIKASDMMNVCLDKIGITASSNPLTNVFAIDKFEFDAGYVSVLGDLLVSESYFGYLNADDQLIVVNLSQYSATGPVIDESKIVDVSGINSGELPGDAVVVRYETLKLNEDRQSEGEVVLKKLNYEFSETSDSPVAIEVKIANNAGTIGSLYYNFAPYTSTTNEYGQDETRNNTLCLLYGSLRDLSDKVIYSEQRTRISFADKAQNWLGQAIFNGITFSGQSVASCGAITDDVITKTYYKYDQNAEEIEKITEIYEPFWSWAGRLGLDFVVTADTYYNILAPGYVLTGKTIVTTEILYAPFPSYIPADTVDTTVERIVNGSKVTTTEYETWGLSQQGNRAISDFREFHELLLAQGGMAEYLDKCIRLVLKNQNIFVTSGRVGMGYAIRPKKQLRVESGGERLTTTSELLYTSGSEIGKRIVEFSMPYQSNDTYTSTGEIVKSDAAEKAATYGRVQNRLLLGNRYGMNIQTSPELTPLKPFDPFILKIGGTSCLYRTNGLTWSMDATGVIVSNDALFWGGIGSDGMGSIWFPVAESVSSLPFEPTIIDTSPTALIGTIATVGTTPQTALNSAFPGAVSGDGVQDLSTDDYWVYDGSLWTNIGPNPGPTMQVDNTVPAWNEVIISDGSVRLGIEIVTYDYPLAILTELDISVYAGIEIYSYFGAEVSFSIITTTTVKPAVTDVVEPDNIQTPEMNVAIDTLTPIIVSGGPAILPGLTTVNVDIYSPAVSSGKSISPSIFNIGVAGIVPNIGEPWINDGSALPISGTDYNAADYTDWTMIQDVTGYGSSSSNWLITNTNDNDGLGTTPGFTFYINNTGHTALYWNSNQYLTFGAGSGVYCYPWITNPAISKLFTGATDCYWSNARVYVRRGTHLGTKYFAIKAEGPFDGSSGSSPIEIIFFETRADKQYIEVRCGSNTLRRYPVALSTGTAFLTPEVYDSGEGVSFVFEGNSTGTTWTRYKDKHIISAYSGQSDPYYSYVSLLLHMNGANNSTVFTDQSPNALTVTSTNAVISTAQSKFGGASGYFNGTSAYLTVPHDIDLNLYTANEARRHTIDCWIYLTSYPAANVDGSYTATILEKGDGSNTEYRLELIGTATSYTGVGFSVGVSGGTLLTGTVNVSLGLNQWYQLAINAPTQLNGIFYFHNVHINNAYYYPSGPLNDSPIPSWVTTTGNLLVGKTYDANHLGFFPGYMDGLRITKGIGRNTFAKYSPTVRPWPTYG